MEKAKRGKEEGREGLGREREQEPEREREWQMNNILK